MNKNNRVRNINEYKKEKKNKYKKSSVKKNKKINN